MDINTKKLKKNAFRVSKVRGLTASRVRVPGGCCNADVMQQAQAAYPYPFIYGLLCTPDQCGEKDFGKGARL